ncbi:unnamed protein product [Rotaria sordida]|uniref:Uncharacterized protein n=1 Tax=Rotaria sordida TaxID=392033 RepID=A0A820B4Z3_9BILA|nr:unnamed protein product [Rotaria sordida]CAF4193555.1 unnamed protein product [Rotaria sordida]
MHEPFVAKFNVNSCDGLFIFITTRKLIATAPLSNSLQVDGTFKLNWNDLSVTVFGSSDGNRRFHPYVIALIGTDEAASGNKLSLSKFLATMEIMLRDWSTKTIEDEFQT